MRDTTLQKNIVKKSIPIVYEDETICIVNKPYGIPVQGGAKISVCLIDILNRQLGAEMLPVHRLDKETAGLLVTAKSAAAARSCRALFDSQAVEKDYIALCFGNVHGPGGCIATGKRAPYGGGLQVTEGLRGKAGTAGRADTAADIGIKGVIDTPVMENGVLKPASSEYRLLAGTEGYGLFTVRLHTGRTHQIRIHLAGIGYPVIGDDKHGDFALNKRLWKTERIKKLQLCSYRLRFPIGGKSRLFTVPLPEHMQEAIGILIPTFTFCNRRP